MKICKRMNYFPNVEQLLSECKQLTYVKNIDSKHLLIFDRSDLNPNS